MARISEKLIMAQIERAMIPRLVDEVQHGVTAAINRNWYRIRRDVSAGTARAVANGSTGATGAAALYARMVREEVIKQSDLARVNKEVAKQVRSAVNRSFAQTVGKGEAGQYRIGESRTTKGGFLMRYSGGSLKRAINSPEMAVGDEDGVRFVDEGRLTKEAAHWARLNFGTAPYTRKKQAFRMVFDGIVVNTLMFDVGTRPGFSMPPGFWQTPGGERVGPSYRRAGNDQFFPASATRKTDVPIYGRNAEGLEIQIGTRKAKTGLNKRSEKITRGIRPRNFLDAGLRALAVQAPAAHMELMELKLANASKKFRNSVPPKIESGRGSFKPGSGYTR